MFERSMVHDSVLSNVLEDCILFSQKTPRSFISLFLSCREWIVQKETQIIVVTIIW